MWWGFISECLLVAILEVLSESTGNVVGTDTLCRTPFNSGTDDLGASKDHITTEVDRLRSHTALTGLIKKATWLESYLSAVVESLETTGAESPVIKDGAPFKEV